MTKIAVRQTILGLLVVLNLSLLASCVYLLRSEMTAAILFCFAFLGAVLTLVVCGVYFTTGSRDTMPFRMVMGYSLWASYRSTRFYVNSLWLILLLASVWLVGPRAIYRIQVRCDSSPVVTATSFLGRELRVPCESQRAVVQLYQPFRTVDVAKDRVSCLDVGGTVFPGVSMAGMVVACNTPPPRSPLRVDRIEPPVIEANRIRRYRLYGSGFTRDTALSLDSASFVGSSLSRDSDRMPAEVGAQGEWMDIFMSVMLVPGRDKVVVKLTNGHNQSAEFSAPVQTTTQR